MIPKNILKEHILAAIREIDENGVPAARRATHYHLKYNNKFYPPKYVVSLACKYANGYELDLHDFGGGKETNGFLSKAGFETECFKKPVTFSMPSKKSTLHNN